MNLRELIIERILYAVELETLFVEFTLTENEMRGLSDLDLLELYEDVVAFVG